MVGELEILFMRGGVCHKGTKSRRDTKMLCDTFASSRLRGQPRGIKRSNGSAIKN